MFGWFVVIPTNCYYFLLSLSLSCLDFAADSLGHTASAEYELAVRSLGAVVWHLKYCLMDQELLSLRSFSIYKPIDAEAEHSSTDEQPAGFTLGTVHMVC